MPRQVHPAPSRFSSSRTYRIVAVAFIHAVLTCYVLPTICMVASAMGAAGIPPLSAFGFAFVISAGLLVVLTFPIGTLVFISDIHLPGALAWLPFIANSALWGLAVDALRSLILRLNKAHGGAA
jgi:hypothetical protein